MSNFLGNSMSSIYRLSNGKSRSICAENPNGEPGGGGKAVGALGPSRKGRPCLTLKKGDLATLADINGSGMITHIWITVTDRTEDNFFVLRDLVLRMYWDGEQEPSVEVPLGDFFCNGFARRCRVNSIPIAVNPTAAMNSYFPMPFRKGAKITIENQHPDDIGGFFFQIDYELNDDIPEDAAYFHAQWRRENPTEYGKDYTIVDGIKGKGNYIGTYLGITALGRNWWGEGEIKFYMDGDKEYPTICGTGTEDYFGGAWSFLNVNGDKKVVENFSSPFCGYPFYERTDNICPEKFFNDDSLPMHGMYRWHIMDPIRFDSELKVTIQQIGLKRGLYERQDDVNSVAYWYQTEPHAKFPELLPVEKRWPR